MRRHTGRLVLAPRDPDCAPEPAILIRPLKEAGFLGAPLTPRGDAYAAGATFLYLVAFTGCAVHLELDPQREPSSETHRPFCHIRIAGPFPNPVVLTGRNTRPPRCPACRTPLRDWRDRFGAGPTSGHARPLSCPHCGSIAAACRWDWKESGGCARLWLCVEEVFPGEANPTDALMRILVGATHTPWRHFYIQD